MNLKHLFGLDEEPLEEEGNGSVVLTIAFNGKTYTRRYPDLDTAQLRFPQYLSEIAVLHRSSEE